MEDEKIIDLFFIRSEQAIQELDDKYGKLCYQLSYRILNDKSDAEECVNDAYLGLWNTIPPARPKPLAAYLCKIVRNISLNRYDKNTAAKRKGDYQAILHELSACLPSPNDVESALETKDLVRSIEEFLDTLTDVNRVIFTGRYCLARSYSDIAEQVGLSEKNVSVRLTRIRKSLKKYLMEKEILS